MNHPALLPSGLNDSLPPRAGREAWLAARLLERFALFGYEQVAPPLLEFEDSLLAGKGAAHATNSFRVMDTLSNRMMGLRADITPQVERIARTMLSPATPLLRLSYAGQVLRVTPPGFSARRQLRQAGLEMIGAPQRVDALEVLSAVIEALQSVGMRSLVLSVSCAGLLEALLAGCLPQSQEAIRSAVYRKDVGALPASMPYRQEVAALLLAGEEVALPKTALPPVAAAMLEAADALCSALEARFSGGLRLLLDPLDTQGFDYHAGLCFTLLDADTRAEIGRGGCYTLEGDIAGCGVTLYGDHLLSSALNWPEAPQVQRLGATVSYEEGRALRDAGVVTLHEVFSTSG